MISLGKTPDELIVVYFSIKNNIALQLKTLERLQTISVKYSLLNNIVNEINSLKLDILNSQQNMDSVINNYINFQKANSTHH